MLLIRSCPSTRIDWSVCALIWPMTSSTDCSIRSSALIWLSTLCKVPMRIWACRSALGPLLTVSHGCALISLTPRQWTWQVSWMWQFTVVKKSLMWNFFCFSGTCSYDTWKRDGKCMLQSQTFSDWDVTVKVGLFKCQSAPWRPAMSLICEGKGCEQAFIPCMVNTKTKHTRLSLVLIYFVV